jgi:site-specific DNA-methyltransferase (adenine-specific)
MVEHHDANESKKPSGANSVTGMKSLGGMRAVVRDYSRPDNLIVDPYAGSGTTLLAAAIEGRRAIGAEIDQKIFALAVKRLSAGWTPAMSFQTTAMKQGGLL